MCFSCPFEGTIAYEQVEKVVRHFVEHGVDKISIEDTNAQANPKIVFERFTKLKVDFPHTVFVGHFHDTNGLALANILAVMHAGIEKFDVTIGWLGGCPFSPGTTGNGLTKKVVSMLHQKGIETHIDEQRLKLATKGI